MCVFDKEKTRLNKSKLSKKKTKGRKWKCVTPLAGSLKSPATSPEIKLDGVNHTHPLGTPSGRYDAA